jgi:hypothetical protein
MTLIVVKRRRREAVLLHVTNTGVSAGADRTTPAESRTMTDLVVPVPD